MVVYAPECPLHAAEALNVRCCIYFLKNRYDRRRRAKMCDLDANREKNIIFFNYN